MRGNWLFRVGGIWTLAAVAAAGACTAEAALVPVTAVTGSHGGNYAGTLSKMIDGSGMTQPDPLDPSTWTATSNSYGNEWQTTSFLTGATNSKIAWAVFDLGSPTSGLQDLYLWNVREAADRGTNAYNLYYADSPAAPLPAAPSSNTLGSDYDFASGGWTLFNTSGALTIPQRGASPAPADAVVNLGGISAQYLGLEILSNQGSTFGSGRVGLAEVGITQIPEPGASFLAALGALGLAFLGWRKR